MSCLTVSNLSQSKWAESENNLDLKIKKVNVQNASYFLFAKLFAAINIDIPYQLLVPVHLIDSKGGNLSDSTGLLKLDGRDVLAVGIDPDHKINGDEPWLLGVPISRVDEDFNKK